MQKMQCRWEDKKWVFAFIYLDQIRVSGMYPVGIDDEVGWSLGEE